MQKIIRTEQVRGAQRRGKPKAVGVKTSTKIIGLTGSIGMGKSTIAAQCQQRRGLVFANSDAMVHQLLSPAGKGFAPVAQAFPEALVDGRIDRQKLGKLVFGNAVELARLEKILHPLVRQENLRIVSQARYQRRTWVVLEIPLLYETGAEVICDSVMVVTAPAFLQRQRVLHRDGMTEEKLQRILQRQVPDAEKRCLADVVIHTGLGRAESFRQLQKILF